MLQQIKKLKVMVDANNIITAITSDKNTDFFNQYITRAYSQVFFQPKLFGVDEAVNDEVVYLNDTIENTAIYYFILSKEQCNGGYQYHLINISNVINAAEKVIAYRENEKTELMNLVPAPFYIKDGKGNYLKLNNYTINDRYSNKTIVGKNDLELWPSRAEELSRHDTLVLKNDKQYTFEEAVTLDDGTDLYYIAQKKPLKDYRNRTIGILGVSIEITDIKRLQRKKLEQKNQALEAKDQLKKQFIKNFSHDVKLPINSIVGSTQH